MSFDIEEFIAHPSKRELDSLLKPQLKQVVQRLGISVENEEKAKKAEMKRWLLDYFVEEDLLSEEELNSVGSESQLEMKRLELEHQARQQEKDRECQLRMKELELKEKEIAAKNELDLKERELAIQKELDFKEKELQIQLKIKELELKAKMTPVSKEPTAGSTNENFDFTRHVKLVPPFQEHEVDKFFLHFEKFATNLHWPSEVQAMLLQSVLIGKAVKCILPYPWSKVRIII